MEHMTDKKISVVIPCYNEADNLSEIVESVVSAFYGRMALEIVIVDDCSSDASYDIAKKLIVRIGRHTKIVVLLTRNIDACVYKMAYARYVVIVRVCNINLVYILGVYTYCSKVIGYRHFALAPFPVIATGFGKVYCVYILYACVYNYVSAV